MDADDLKEKLVESPSINDMDWIRNEILMLYKLSGKTKRDRQRNRSLMTWLGVLLIIVQLIGALAKIFKSP